MKTDELIARLAAEAKPVAAGWPGRATWLALASGGAMSLGLFALVLGPRSDLLVAMGSPAVLAKTLLPLAAGLLLLPRALAAARPGAHSPRATAAVWAVPLALAALVAWAIAVPPPQGRMAAFLGHSIAYCAPAILVLSLPITWSLLRALSAGAPERPWACGTLAGLASGGLATTLYSLFCNEDSPLFYGTWYSLGIALAALAGGLLGRRLLRW